MTQSAGDKKGIEMGMKGIPLSVSNRAIEYRSHHGSAFLSAVDITFSNIVDASLHLPSLVRATALVVRMDGWGPANLSAASRSLIAASV